MKSRAQGILDYVFALLIVIASLLIMGYYIKSGFSGKYRQTADVFGGGEVYQPENTTITITTSP